MQVCMYTYINEYVHIRICIQMTVYVQVYLCTNECSYIIMYMFVLGIYTGIQV